MRTLLNSKAGLWIVLALPGLAMLAALASAQSDTADLLASSGETAARLMIAAMAIAPLVDLLGPRPWLRWIMARRRYLGVAAFGYALFHLVLYVIDMGDVADILAELGAPGIWTGWAAFALLVPLALTSNDAAVRAMKAGWKRLQRLVYPAAVLTLLHWVFVHSDMVAALAHFVPLAVLLALRALKPRPTFAKG